MTKLPLGFRVGGVHAGLKRNPNKQDVALVVSDQPAVTAGVYTLNAVCAAPVVFDRQRTPSDEIRVVVINSGNANACTGQRGMQDAGEMCRVAAAAVDVRAEQALVLSTGIIGEFLPMEKISAGIHATAAGLGTDEEHLIAAARGMLTTDSRHKLASRELHVDGKDVTITGMAKGAAMIGPNMATMLGVIMTDAKLEIADADRLLKEIVNETFNCISVEGHMSTNDTVLLLANGAAGGETLSGADLEKFAAALHEVCAELAESIPADGEGVSHLVTIDIQGAASKQAARQIAKTVAESALVKTAIAGADPNWGRVVSAVGYAGVPFDPLGLTLHIEGILLYEQGAPVPFDAAQVSTAISDDRNVHILLKFTDGDASLRFWTTDLTAEYVRLNADYHT